MKVLIEYTESGHKYTVGIATLLKALNLEVTEAEITQAILFLNAQNQLVPEKTDKKGS